MICRRGDVDKYVFVEWREKLLFLFLSRSCIYLLDCCSPLHSLHSVHDVGLEMDPLLMMGTLEEDSGVCLLQRELTCHF